MIISRIPDSAIRSIWKARLSRISKILHIMCGRTISIVFMMSLKRRNTHFFFLALSGNPIRHQRRIARSWGGLSRFRFTLHCTRLWYRIRASSSRVWRQVSVCALWLAWMGRDSSDKTKIYWGNPKTCWGLYLESHYTKVFSYFKPSSESYAALKNACKKLKIPLISCTDESLCSEISGASEEVQEMS